MSNNELCYCKYSYQGGRRGHQKFSTEKTTDQMTKKIQRNNSYGKCFLCKTSSIMRVLWICKQCYILRRMTSTNHSSKYLYSNIKHPFQGSTIITKSYSIQLHQQTIDKQIMKTEVCFFRAILKIMTIGVSKQATILELKFLLLFIEDMSNGCILIFKIK